MNTNSNYITANGNVEVNIRQSSTGNVYGIYDLSGCAFEYLAAYYNFGDNLSYGSSFAIQGGRSTVYATVYTGTNESTDYKVGDATYETRGWDGDDTHFIDSTHSFFNRGGRYRSGSLAGIFNFNYGNGRKSQ